MKIQILTEALFDLEEGHQFYENQDTGLGGYFLNALFSDIDSLALNGGIHPKIQGYHRRLSNHFPYAVYYALRDNVVEVWRVLDCRQDPARIRRQLGRTK